MGRVAVNYRDALIDQPAGEVDLLIGDAVAPVAAPMYRGHNHVAGPRSLQHTVCDATRRLFRQVLQQVDAGSVPGRGPLSWDAACRRAERENQRAPFARHIELGRSEEHTSELQSL